MHVTDTGSGTPLVLLHAFPLDSRMWDPVRTALAGHARVITPDLPGFGTTQLATAEPDLDVYAAQVIALLDQLRLERVMLGGCSMGGYVAMAVLRAAPERVAGLVLIDTKPTADAAQARDNRYAMAERAEREGVGEWLLAAMMPILVGSTTMRSRPEVVDTLRRMVGEQSGAAVAWAQRAMAARPDSTAVLREADVPALVLCGEQDTLVSVETARSMADLLQRSELVVLSDSGHLPPVETPAELSTAVGTWLGSTG
jgi:pimeloyl-ACP methyl ester carboxylesterase